LLYDLLSTCDENTTVADIKATLAYCNFYEFCGLSPRKQLIKSYVIEPMVLDSLKGKLL